MWGEHPTGKVHGEFVGAFGGVGCGRGLKVHAAEARGTPHAHITFRQTIHMKE